MFIGLSQHLRLRSGNRGEQLPSLLLATNVPAMGRHPLSLLPTSHPQYPSSVLRLVLALALGRSLNLPQGDRSSVTLAIVLLPSSLDPRSLALSLPFGLPRDQIIPPTERRSRWEIGTPIPEMISVPAGKRHLLNPLPSTLFQTTAKRIPTSTTSSADRRIPHLRSQSQTPPLHVRET